MRGPPHQSPQAALCPTAATAAFCASGGLHPRPRGPPKGPEEFPKHLQRRPRLPADSPGPTELTKTAPRNPHETPQGPPQCNSESSGDTFMKSEIIERPLVSELFWRIGAFQGLSGLLLSRKWPETCRKSCCGAALLLPTSSTRRPIHFLVSPKRP